MWKRYGDGKRRAGINHYSRRSFKIAAFGGSVLDCVSEYNSNSAAAKNGSRGGLSLTQRPQSSSASRFTAGAFGFLPNYCSVLIILSVWLREGLDKAFPFMMARFFSHALRSVV